mmetsp:Transcript_21854/g.35201  ORF Transcript_21854/g.35201 Transcript_21854/m.35201 type:complete len:249 (+) Transcript_21854:1216-1962(+)|eukprot:CAMPEP_0203756300 /NCGR_PEP_ID=MMETSP0098-20131031/9603_1 /ASSEMBLY_ACC=CAM_ASM_000208 /TAXON_ID=96639 /ORGANISM=" , Strain NY0313808BC1" /LENGTH=248 /DNA_ID=CAMNT_0050648127 /DNA_START=516 /DNA_END=1262 /DNA_ORIENTATION=-
MHRQPFAQRLIHNLRALNSNANHNCIYVCAVLDARNGAVIPVNHKNSPKSEIDAFALNAARAVSNVTITTGKNIRQESPHWSADLFGESSGYLDEHVARKLGTANRQVYVLSRNVEETVSYMPRMNRQVVFFHPSDTYTSESHAHVCLENTCLNSVVEQACKDYPTACLIEVEAGPSTMFQENCTLTSCQKLVDRFAVLLTTFYGSVCPTVPTIYPCVPTRRLQEQKKVAFSHNWETSQGHWDMKLLV